MAELPVPYTFWRAAQVLNLSTNLSTDEQVKSVETSTLSGAAFPFEEYIQALSQLCGSEDQSGAWEEIVGGSTATICLRWGLGALSACRNCLGRLPTASVTAVSCLFSQG